MRNSDSDQVLGQQMPPLPFTHLYQIHQERVNCLYCCFIDYIKAFDSVAHVKLWLKLSRIGITGKLLNVIKSMYSKLNACVRLDSNYSDIFTYNVGLMQMESLSPLLYSLYVNDIEVELINQGCQSYELKKFNFFF